MKKGKRIISGILAAVTMSTMFAGCSVGKKEDNSKTKIVVWKNSGHDKAFLQKKFQEFNETIGKEKGIDLEYIVKEGDMEEMLDVAFKSEQAPDLFNTYKIEARAQMNQIAAFEDIDGSKDLLDKYGSRALELRHKYLGKTYTIPLTSATYGLIYNKQMFIDAGIVDENGDPKPPVTWDEVVEDAKKLTDVSNQQYGIIFPGKWGGWYTTDVNMASSAINGLVDGYNPKTGKFDFSGMVPVMDAMIRIKKDGSCVPGTEGMDNDPARARFGQGKIGMKIAGSYDVGVLKEQFPAKIEWGVAPLPIEKEGEEGIQYCSADGMFVVNKASVEKIGADKIMAVLNFFASDEILIDQYKEGISIPVDYNLVKDVEIPEDMQNWKKFASFVQFSQCPPLAIKTDMTGEQTADELWLDIWNRAPEKAEIEKELRDYTDKCNDGIAKYKEIHPDYDSTPYIFPDWKLMR